LLISLFLISVEAGVHLKFINNSSHELVFKASDFRCSVCIGFGPKSVLRVNETTSWTDHGIYVVGISAPTGEFTYLVDGDENNSIGGDYVGVASCASEDFNSKTVKVFGGQVGDSSHCLLTAVDR